MVLSCKGSFAVDTKNGFDSKLLLLLVNGIEEERVARSKQVGNEADVNPDCSVRARLLRCMLIFAVFLEFF